jgi:hypothetical protein
MYEWPAKHSAFIPYFISMILGRPDRMKGLEIVQTSDNRKFEENDLAKWAPPSPRYPFQQLCRGTRNNDNLPQAIISDSTGRSSIMASQPKVITGEMTTSGRRRIAAEFFKTMSAPTEKWDDPVINVGASASAAKELEYFGELQSCKVGIEACPSVHHRGRELQLCFACVGKPFLRATR